MMMRMKNEILGEDQYIRARVRWPSTLIQNRVLSIGIAKNVLNYQI